jgi:NADH-quinone oxidoreductase subunit G
MLESALKSYVLLGALDPSSDFAVDARALASAERVVAVTTHLPENLRSVVHVVLPIGSFAETSGTYVNAEGRWQSWAGASKLLGESRPGWKVLRVLANLLNLRGVDYVSSEEVREALKAVSGARIEPTAPEARSGGVGGAGAAGGAAVGGAAPGAWVDIPPYQGDALVRGSEALSKTKDGRLARSGV